MRSSEWCECSDEQLVAGILQRHEEALRSLMKRFLPVVFGLSSRMLGGASIDAEEVTSDVFVTIWQHPERYQPGRSQVRTYILLLTRSRCLDRLREKRRDRARYQDESSLNDLRCTDDELADVYSAETSKIVRQAMGDLSPNQRRAIELAFFSGMTHSEIAEQLHSPLGSVKSHIRRGLAKLRSLVSASAVGERES